MHDWIRRLLDSQTAGVVLSAGAVLLGERAESRTTRHGTGDSSLVDWNYVRTIATGAAYQGPWRMNDSEWSFVDDPAVALSGDGTVGVMWTDHVAQDLFFLRFPRRYPTV